MALILRSCLLVVNLFVSDLAKFLLDSRVIRLKYNLVMTKYYRIRVITGIVMY